MARVHNFAAGPTALPLPVLERARGDLIEYEGTGMSILEHSHRGPSYLAVHAEAKGLLRELLAIPESFEILFMQGGARGQFAFVPMNLLPSDGFAEYVVTGTWGEKALAEARRLGDARELVNTIVDGRFVRVPPVGEVQAAPSAAYLHITTNNTIFGTQFHEYPDAHTLVADMSSDIASRPIPIDRFGLIYAGAQKNLGIPGLTVLIARKDVVDRSSPSCPEILRYSKVLEADSLGNTAPTFAIYMLRNVLTWVKEQGGLNEMERRNAAKAKLLYDLIDDRPEFFRAPVETASRSLMNVVFRLPNEQMEAKLVADAQEAGFVGIKGHRSAGGLRISLYNAVELASVELLAGFLRDFSKNR